MNQPHEAPMAAEWLAENPVVLSVSAGRVRKSNIAQALRISDRRFRTRVREVLDSRPELEKLYEPTAKEIPMTLAEVLVQEIFDHHPGVRVKFEWLGGAF